MSLPAASMFPMGKAGHLPVHIAVWRGPGQDLHPSFSRTGCPSPVHPVRDRPHRRLVRRMSGGGGTQPPALPVRGIAGDARPGEFHLGAPGRVPSTARAEVVPPPSLRPRPALRPRGCRAWGWGRGLPAALPPSSRWAPRRAGRPAKRKQPAARGDGLKAIPDQRGREPMLVDPNPPDATAKPVPVTEQRYACPWCHQSWTWRPNTVNHMQCCPMRPELAEVSL